MNYQINKKIIPIDGAINAIIKIVEVAILVGTNERTFRNLFGLFRRAKIEKYPVIEFFESNGHFFGLVENMNIGEGIYKSGYFSQTKGWAMFKEETLNVEGGLKELSQMLIEKKIIVLR